MLRDDLHDHLLIIVPLFAPDLFADATLPYLASHVTFSLNVEYTFPISFCTKSFYISSEIL